MGASARASFHSLERELEKLDSVLVHVPGDHGRGPRGEHDGLSDGSYEEGLSNRQQISGTRPRPGSRSDLSLVKLVVEHQQAPSPQLLDRIFDRSRGLIASLAVRFRGQGESLEDLRQVGCIGLLKAVERFKLERGVDFSTFAAVTIAGEIKRHLRDRCVVLKTPRHLLEVKSLVARAREELSQELGRYPTLADVAAAIGTSQDTVLKSLQADRAHRTVSCSDIREDDEDSLARGLNNLLGAVEPGFEEVENRVALERAQSSLTPQERVLLHLRFRQGLSQMETARILGVSQARVSRWLKKTLDRLRGAMDDGARAFRDRQDRSTPTKG